MTKPTEDKTRNRHDIALGECVTTQDFSKVISREYAIFVDLMRLFPEGLEVQATNFEDVFKVSFLIRSGLSEPRLTPHITEQYVIDENVREKVKSVRRKDLEQLLEEY